MRTAPVAIALVNMIIAACVGCTQDFGYYQATQSTSTGSGASSSTTTAAGSGGAMTTTATSTSASSSSTTSSDTTSSSATTTAATASSSSTMSPCSTIDCTDPMCQDAYECVPKTPAGWNGPILFYEGDPSSLPACPASHPTLANTWHGGLMPQPAQCGACDCMPPAVTCTPAALAFSDSATCALASSTAVQPAPGQCGTIQPAATTKASSAAAPTATAGMCTIVNGTKKVPAAVWARGAVGCVGGGLGGGCGSTGVCAAKSEPPFVSGLCIWASGDLPCPTGFADKHSYAAGVVDTRDCSACGCGGTNADCTATTTVYTNGTCGGTTVTVPNDGSCVANATGGSIKVAVSGKASCTPKGGDPTGTIVENPLRTTVCCPL